MFPATIRSVLARRSSLGGHKDVYKAMAGDEDANCTICLFKLVRPTATICGHVVSKAKYSLVSFTVQKRHNSRPNLPKMSVPIPIRTRWGSATFSSIYNYIAASVIPRLVRSLAVGPFTARLFIRTKKNPDAVLP